VASAFREQRLREIGAPDRITGELAVALDIANHIDESDSELRALALVIWHCARAVCLATEPRTP
jgi:hypothetical protein